MAPKGRSNLDFLRFLMTQAGSGRLIVLAILMLISGLTEGVGLLLLVPITQLVAAAEGPPIANPWLADLAELPLAWLLVAFVVLISMRAALVFMTAESRRALGVELGASLRRRAHESILNARWRWLAQQNSADHAALIMGEADRVAGLANQSISIVASLVTLAVLTAVAAMISPPLTLLVVALGLAVGVAVSISRIGTANEGKAYFLGYSALQRLVSNGVQHLRAARIANAQAELNDRFSHASDHLVELETRYFRRGHRNVMLFQIAAALILAVLVYLALEVMALPLAIFLPVLVIAVRMAPLASRIQESLRGWHHATPALNELLDLFEDARANREHDDQSGPAVKCKSTIELRDVILRYQSRPQPVLDRFSLCLRKGQIIGVSGASGSGKSSMADCISGLVAPDEGELAIDAQTLDENQRVRWRKQVAYVEQNPFLFDGTIRDNLAWGRGNCAENALDGSLTAASARFVYDLPEGLETMVGEGGRKLSGGERQRIALARALIGRPDLIILDEFSAGLDRENTAQLLQTIEGLRENCAILLLSHDPQVLEAADEVIELVQPNAAQIATK